MNISSVQKAISVGIAVENDRYCLALCERGSAICRREFAISTSGQSKLKYFLADLKSPARIAVCASTAAAVAMAVALSTIPQSEIFLVSPSLAAQSVELARYAERTV